MPVVFYTCGNYTTLFAVYITLQLLKILEFSRPIDCSGHMILGQLCVASVPSSAVNLQALRTYNVDNSYFDVNLHNASKDFRRRSSFLLFVQVYIRKKSCAQHVSATFYLIGLKHSTSCFPISNVLAATNQFIALFREKRKFTYLQNIIN